MADPLPNILSAVKNDLIDAATVVGGKVFMERYPKPAELLPYILVYPMEEESENEELGPDSEVDHELLVAVAIVAATADPAEAQLLTLRQQVRAALEVYPPLGDLVSDLDLVKCDWPPSENGEIPITALRLQYSIEFTSKP